MTELKNLSTVKVLNFFFFFLVRQRFDLRASCLHNRYGLSHTSSSLCSGYIWDGILKTIFCLFLAVLGQVVGTRPTTWTTPPVLLCDGFFQDRVSWTICPGWLQTAILFISASRVARITGAQQVLKTICLGWPQTETLLILASQVARITAMSHQCLERYWILIHRIG
jgi:hypothetical protein